MTAPEAIHEDCETVSLANVYAIFAYYLHHWYEVESYLDGQRQQAAAIPLESRRSTHQRCVPDRSAIDSEDWVNRVIYLPLR